jgi:hypothetical protein
MNGMHLLFDSRIDIVAALRKDDDNKCWNTAGTSLTFRTSSKKLLRGLLDIFKEACNEMTNLTDNALSRFPFYKARSSVDGYTYKTCVE